MRWITILVMFCSNTIFSQYTTLSFKVKDSLKRQIVFFEPIDGHANRSIPTYVIRDISSSKESFKRTIKITQPVAIEIRFGYEPLWLYLEPNQNILIDINLNLFTSKGTNGGLKIYGPNSKGNEYFNQFNFQPGVKFRLVDDILSNHTFDDPKAMVHQFIFRVDSSFAYLKKLKSLKLISPKFYKMVTNDLALSYVSEYGLSLSQSKIKKTYKTRVIDSLYKIYSPENPENLQGLFSDAYYYRYGVYKNTLTYNSGLLAEDSVIQIGNSNYKIVKNFIPYIYLKGQIMKFEWGMGLYQYKTFFPDRFKETDLAPYLKKFPDSWLTHTLGMKAGIKNDSGSLNYVSTVDSSKIILLDPDSITSFKDIFYTYFKNKIVYVDFWATWCLPCKEEFSFNTSLDSFFLNNKIERLYVSFDIPGNSDAVLKNIYSFRLYGNHLLLTKAIFDDIITKLYDGNSTYSIPRYLIVNRTSQIVDDNAKRPSSGKELLDQLSFYIK